MKQFSWRSQSYILFKYLFNVLILSLVMYAWRSINHFFWVVVAVLLLPLHFDSCRNIKWREINAATNQWNHSRKVSNRYWWMPFVVFFFTYSVALPFANTNIHFFLLRSIQLNWNVHWNWNDNNRAVCATTFQLAKSKSRI